MSGILAIESDPQRQALLIALIREHVQVDVTMVASVNDAISKFEQTQPDVIVAPALLPPGDSEQLTAHVQQHADPHVEMLTIAALDLLRELPETETRGFGLFRRRRPVCLGLQYDPALVGKQIADGAARAQTARSEHANIVRRPVKLTPSPAGRPVLREAQASASVHDRRWAERSAQKTPWLWVVRLPWGTDVDLVNISRTGVLLESGSKVSPGVTLELQLSGMGLDRVVLARFVRSEIARVDRLGVRYHAAAQFEQPLDILAPRTEPPSPSGPRSLAELFTSVLSDSNHLEAPSVRFARGLRGLVAARDVLIRRTPMAPGADCESIYFRVKGDERSGTILQVLFDRNRALTATEFRLLKAAAGLTAAVLELERVSTGEAGSSARGIAAVA
jgi:CheY-like chemotaxis protein